MIAAGLAVVAGLFGLALASEKKGESVKVSGSVSERIRKYAPRVVAASKAAGVDPLYMLATAYHESRFDPDAVNMTGGDLARGGAFGMFQMTFKTAAALGYKGAPEGLKDFETNLSYALKLARQNAERAEKLDDMASLYNSGKKYYDAPAVTRTMYVPAIKSAYEAAKAWV